MPSEFQVVLCTCPDPSSAEAIGQRLIEARLAACVNIVPGLRSIYRWEGAIERAEECLLVIKARRERYAELERMVVDHHPYELPEVIAISIEEGLPAYLAWVAQNTDTAS